ncbi:MAG: hypothetical protein JW873_00955 [Candidatus Saganbacteria bacterium]|nr:hypothetical protein [Candidatus Saganbacteria bacterium]
MFKKIALALCAAALLAGLAAAQEYTPQQIKKAKADLVAVQNEITRLSGILRTTVVSAQRADIVAKIKVAQFKAAGLQKIINSGAPAAAAKPPVRKTVPLEKKAAAAKPAAYGGLTLPEVRKYKAEIVKLQKDVARLTKKLKFIRSKKQKDEIQVRIKWEKAKIAQLKEILYPKAPPRPAPKRVFPPSTVEAIATVESFPEEMVSAEVRKPERRRLIGIQPEVGCLGGVFAGAGGFFAEGRLPLKRSFGPATTALRLSAGYVQTNSADRRYVPVNLDLILNFPPGWFSGVENYLGGGLNYVALTSGRTQGTVGGELFYGIQSDGFGGIVFGEIGYALLRTGFSPSSKGLTVAVGFREPLWF